MCGLTVNSHRPLSPDFFFYSCVSFPLWYSDICKDLWQERDSSETMHANRWRAEIVVDVATEKK